MNPELLEGINENIEVEKQTPVVWNLHDVFRKKKKIENELI